MGPVSPLTQHLSALIPNTRRNRRKKKIRGILFLYIHNLEIEIQQHCKSSYYIRGNKLNQFSMEFTIGHNEVVGIC